MEQTALDTSVLQDQSLKVPLLENTKVPTKKLTRQRYTKHQIAYVAHLKMQYADYEVVRREFKKRYGIDMPLSTLKELHTNKKAKKVFESIREKVENNMGFEFYSFRLNRIRALSTLYEKAEAEGKLNICHDIIKTLNEMYEPKHENGDRFYIQNNEYHNMTVPQLKEEIRVLSRKIGPELLKITQEGLDAS